MVDARSYILGALTVTLVLLLCVPQPDLQLKVQVSSREAHPHQPLPLSTSGKRTEALPAYASHDASAMTTTTPSPSPPPPPPPPPPPLRSSSVSSQAVRAACALVADAPNCRAWAAAHWAEGRADEAERKRAFASASAALRPQPIRRCEADCHGRGVCNEETGVCNCRAGFNGSACATLNPRPCNGGKNDGLWHGSHCAGECDEATGFCWCPGKVGVRPMGESCQPVRMPLDVYAALNLYTDIWEGTSADGARVVDPCPAADRSKQRLRKQQLDARNEELGRDAAQRGRVLADYWFGNASSARRIEVNRVGIPRVRSSGAEGGGGGGGGGGAASRGGGEVPFFKKPTARGTALGTDGPRAWCEGSRPKRRCGCTYDGVHGPLCEGRHEAFCLNQCSGHGRCDAHGGYCHCDDGHFGADCSLTSAKRRGGGTSDGAPPPAVSLHAGHAALHAPRRPYVYVYELPRMTTLILQYRNNPGMCSHRKFEPDNETSFNGGWVYTSDVALHEWLLRSPHRVADGRLADFFYVPLYLSCAMNPVYDYIGPAPYSPQGYAGIPPRPIMAMRMTLSALQQIRREQPFWNASGGRDHVFLFSHDEGGCWAPKEVASAAILLTHWGRMDDAPSSSSRYPQDNWQQHVAYSVRSPWGERWDFGARGGGGRMVGRMVGARGMIGTHKCYDPQKDLVVPVYATPDKFASSPWLGVAPRARMGGDGRGVPLEEALRLARPTLAYFSGNLAHNEPLRYSRGIRHRLRAAFGRTPGWMLVGGRGPRYSSDLARSQFCVVPPGGDGWSSRADDAVRHGCIPVIIMDNVHMPFESVIDYAAFALRVPEKDVERLDTILRAVTPARQRTMREAMAAVWTRFTYARSFHDDGFLPRGRGLPRGFLRSGTMQQLKRHTAGAQAPDAFDTLMMALHARTRGRHALRKS